MLSLDELRSLPNDPDAAFVELDNIARSKVLEVTAERSDWRVERTYVMYIIAYIH